jgi:hypothetical protein
MVLCRDSLRSPAAYRLPNFAQRFIDQEASR